MTTTVTTTTYPLAIIEPVPLTAADRCDRCSSQAYVRATLPSGAELLFCGHHGGEHRAALAVAGASFHDETDKLSAVRGSGSA
jgi:hypothetical protein